MVDAMVGKWVGHTKDITGMKEYFDAIGKPEEMAKYAEYKETFYTEITKEGDNEYKSEFHFEGWSTPMVERFTPEGKGIQGVAGFGNVEITSTSVGNSIVRTGNVDGVEFKFVVRVENDCFLWETTAKGATFVMRSYRA